LTTTKTAAATKTPTVDKDVIALLRSDGGAVSHLFAEDEKTHSVTDKNALVADICAAVIVHAQIEEEIFYPAVRAASRDKLLVTEAMVEQAGVKDPIARLEGVEPDGELYDTRVKVLSQYVKHHVKEEQQEMFPKAKASSLDMTELGPRMTTRKDDLMAHKA